MTTSKRPSGCTSVMGRSWLTPSAGTIVTFWASGRKARTTTAGSAPTCTSCGPNTANGSPCSPRTIASIASAIRVEGICEISDNLAHHGSKDNTILTCISIAATCPMASSPLCDHDSSDLAEGDKMTHPFLRLSVSSVALVAKCGISPLEQFVIDVLDLPQIHLEGQSPCQVHHRLKSLQQSDLGRLYSKVPGQSVNRLFQRMPEAGGVKLNAPHPGVPQQGLDTVGIGRFFPEASAEIGVQDDLCSRMEDLGQRDTERTQKMHQRGVVLVELAIGGLSLGRGRFKDEVEDLSLFVAKERFERVGRCSEVPVQEPDDFREVRAGKRLGQLLRHGLIGLLIPKRLDAAAQVVIAHVQNPEAESRRFPCDLTGNPYPPYRQFRPAGLSEPVLFAINGVTVHLGRLTVRFKKGAHRVMGANRAEVYHRRLHELLIDMAAVLVLKEVTSNSFEPFQERGLIRSAKQLFGQLDDAPGVLDDLYRLYP